MIELQIRRSSAGDRQETFEMPVITIGRDPTSAIRFDLADDLEVSTRHAEVTEDDEGVYSITDKESTNGTWVNGARVRGSRRIYPGDLIQLGRSGPKIRVIAIEDERWTRTVENKVKLPPLTTDTGSRRQHTREFMITMVETRTRSFRFAVLAILGVVAGLGIAGWWYARSINTEDPQVMTDVTAPSIKLANDAAVVLVETRIAGACEHGCEGTGFSISIAGLIVTNRHVVMQGKAVASRIRVKFANTSAWVPATFVRAAPDAGTDVALIQVTKPGRYPAVVSVNEAGPDLGIGSQVVTIGFPLGTLLRMEGKGDSSIAKTTLTIGTIGKQLLDVFQIDAFADHGSSGSPVFDRHGHVVGVIASGDRNEDKIEPVVYVVPSDRIVALEKTPGARK